MFFIYDCMAIFSERTYDRMRPASQVTCMAMERKVSVQDNARSANGDKMN
jgi:hypothetical protein